MSDEQRTTPSVDPAAAAPESMPTTPPVDPAAAAPEPAASTVTPPAMPAASKATAPAKPAPAARPAKAPAPPDPRVEAANAEAEKLKAALVAKLGETVVEEAGHAHHKPMVRIRRDGWRQAVEFLKTEPDWQLNYVECMAGTDYPDYIEIVIYVQSTAHGHFVCLKTRTPRDAAEVPSLVSVHPGVNWEEREIYDLLGVRFTDHPDLRRIMMWDEFPGHPLRKDYNEWNGGDPVGADGSHD